MVVHVPMPVLLPLILSCAVSPHWDGTILQLAACRADERENPNGLRGRGECHVRFSALAIARPRTASQGWLAIRNLS